MTNSKKSKLRDGVMLAVAGVGVLLFFATAEFGLVAAGVGAGLASVSAGMALTRPAS